MTTHLSHHLFYVSAVSHGILFKIPCYILLYLLITDLQLQKTDSNIILRTSQLLPAQTYHIRQEWIKGIPCSDTLMSDLPLNLFFLLGLLIYSEFRPFLESSLRNFITPEIHQMYKDLQIC